MVKSSDLAWISVKDLKKAQTFFTEKVGLKVQSASEEWGWAELSGEEGGSVLGLAQGDSEIKPGCNAIMTFTVSDIAKTCAAFEKAGVELVGDVMEVPGHCKLQMFKDPDGNTFQLVEMLD